MTLSSFTGCDLHIPHKDWADPVERENYLAIERWALRFRKDGIQAQREGRVSPQFTGFDLHVPHKNWSGDERERQNYLEMERWVNQFRRNCIPPCAEAAPTGPPEIILGAAVVPYPLTYPLTRTMVSWQTQASNPSIVRLLGGITEYDYSLAGNVLGYRLPAATYTQHGAGFIDGPVINFAFWFYERTPGGSFVPGTALRTLELEIRTISTNTLTHNWVQEVTVPRDEASSPTGNPGAVSIASPEVTIVVAEPSVLRAFATWHTVGSGGVPNTRTGVSISWEMWLYGYS